MTRQRIHAIGFAICLVALMLGSWMGFVLAN